MLTGALADQAALYGVPAAVEALGPELTEVRRLMPDEPRGAIVTRPLRAEPTPIIP